MSFANVASPITPLISDLSDLENEFELNYLDGCWFFRVPLADSECGRWQVFLDVGYREYRNSPCSGIPEIDYVMFGYEITLMDLIDGEVYQTMDPQEAQRVVPKEMRAIILDIVCLSYKKHVEALDPAIIYRFTFVENPTEASLKKHEQHTNTLESLGYTVLKDGSDELGRKFWLLTKVGLEIMPSQSNVL